MAEKYEAEVQVLEGIPLRERAAERQALAEAAYRRQQEAEAARKRAESIKDLESLLLRVLGIDAEGTIQATLVEIDGILLGAYRRRIDRGNGVYSVDLDLWQYGLCSKCGVPYQLRLITGLACLANAPVDQNFGKCFQCTYEEGEESE